MSSLNLRQMNFCDKDKTVAVIYIQCVHCSSQQNDQTKPMVGGQENEGV